MYTLCIHKMTNKVFLRGGCTLHHLSKLLEFSGFRSTLKGSDGSHSSLAGSGDQNWITVKKRAKCLTRTKNGCCLSWSTSRDFKLLICSNKRLGLYWVLAQASFSKRDGVLSDSKMDHCPSVSTPCGIWHPAGWLCLSVASRRRSGGRGRERGFRWF